MLNLASKSTSQGCGGCLMGSVFGVIFGVGLFLGAFVLLWTNEGRTDLSTIADDSIAISATTIDPAHEGELVAAAGTLSANEPIGDADFLQPGAYLYLERTVEMYAWVEEARPAVEDEYDYLYETTWTDDPKSSETFTIKEGHTNPPFTIEGAEFIAPAAQIGAFRVNLNAITLPTPEPLHLTEAMVVAGTEGRVIDTYLYQGDGSPGNPQVGDIRIGFHALPSGLAVTVFGNQSGDTLQPYVRGNDQLYLAYEGNRADAIESLHSTYQVMGWLFRVVGFLMMWGGLTIVGGPLTGMLSFLPVVGNLGRAVIGAIMFVVALILSAITIFIAALLQNIIALIVLLLFIVGVGGWLYWQRTRQKSAIQTEAMV